MTSTRMCSLVRRRLSAHEKAPYNQAVINILNQANGYTDNAYTATAIPFHVRRAIPCQSSSMCVIGDSTVGSCIKGRNLTFGFCLRYFWLVQ